MSKKQLLAALLCVSLLTGCSKQENPNTTDEANQEIQQLASANFDYYLQTHKQNLKEITEDTKLSETEKVLYDFLVALNNKDYPVAMRLSNYCNNPFATEQDFQDALSINNDTKYNYATIVSKDLDKSIKLNIIPVNENPNMMITTVLLDDTYEYIGALVKINDTWKVAVSGLSECLFELSANETLIINGIEIDDYFKITDNIYKVLLPNNNSYSTTVECKDHIFSGNIGNKEDFIEFQMVLSDTDIDNFIKWEQDYYNNLYKDYSNGLDISKYFNNDKILQKANIAFVEQKSKKIKHIEVTNIVPTRHLDAPVKKIDSNTIEANVTVTIAYTYLDNLGKTHVKDGLTDSKVSAIFKREDENSEWKMDEILGSDPMLTNSKF